MPAGYHFHVTFTSARVHPPSEIGQRITLPWLHNLRPARLVVGNALPANREEAWQAICLVQLGDTKMK